MTTGSVDLHVAKEFASCPAGRDERDGPRDGTRFRGQLLLPRYREAREKNAELSIHFEGVMSFGSSFLEEAFGGLERTGDVDGAELRRTLRLHPGRPGNQRYMDAIERYIRKARSD